MTYDDSIVNQLFDELRGFMRALHSSEGAALLSVDLTMPQLKTLFVICIEGRVSGRELARALGVGPSAITPLIDRLVERSYVRRAEDVDDRRITWIYPTDNGLSLIDQLQTTRREQFGRMVAHLSPAELRLVLQAFGILRRAPERDQPRCEVEENSD